MHKYAESEQAYRTALSLLPPVKPGKVVTNKPERAYHAAFSLFPPVKTGNVVIAKSEQVPLSLLFLVKTGGAGKSYCKSCQ